MDIKKNPKLETAASSNLFFTGGLVVALSLTFFAFEYKTYDEMVKPEPLEVPVNIGVIEIPDIPVIKAEKTPITPLPQEPKFNLGEKEKIDTTKIIDETEVDTKQQVPEGDTTTNKKPITNFKLPEKPIVEDDTPLTIVSESASFPGGKKEYINFLSKNLTYPTMPLRNGKEGTVYVKFIIEKDGSIIKDCVKISKPIDPALDAEAIRVVRMSPNWTPAKQQERKVRQRMIVPVKFKIDK